MNSNGLSLVSKLVCSGLAIGLLVCSFPEGAASQVKADSGKHIRRSVTGMRLPDDYVPNSEKPAQEIRVVETIKIAKPTAPATELKVVAAEKRSAAAAGVKVANATKSKPASKSTSIPAAPKQVHHLYNGDNAEKVIIATQTDPPVQTHIPASAPLIVKQDRSIGGQLLNQETGTTATTLTMNTFVGNASGFSNTEGHKNSFVGEQAGFYNDKGNSNCFMGVNAGFANRSGSYNAFYGTNSGQANTSGITNSFVGTNAGYSNTTGSSNTCIGFEAGYSNTTGSRNIFTGQRAGSANIDGDNNTFVGESAGLHNVGGKNNLFLGHLAGYSLTTEQDNTFVGTVSDGTPGITNATAIGAHARVTASNSVILGNNANVGIKTNSPVSELEIGGNGTITLAPRSDDPVPSRQGFKLYVFQNGSTSELRMMTPDGKIITVSKADGVVIQ